MTPKKVKRFRTIDQCGNPHDIVVGYRDINQSNKEDPQRKVYSIHISEYFDQPMILEMFDDCMCRYHNLKSVDSFDIDKEEV